MDPLYKFLFPREETFQSVSVAALIIRLIFGILIMSHGFTKLMDFNILESTFPDPLQVGPQLSLMLAIFAELFCGFAFTIGFLFRIVLIPLTFTMCIIIFLVNANAPFAYKELPFAYLCIFITAFMLGPGKYSIDYIIGRMLFKE